MRSVAIALSIGVLVVSGCLDTGALQGGPGTQRVGVPRLPFDAGILPDAAETQAKGAGDDALRLPDRITLPASYRAMLVGGHLTLVREADAQVFDRTPASLRVVAGEIARGELAYQPGLLPQELAAEVASNRESSARMDTALEAVMRRSRELSEQAMALDGQSRRLASALAAAEARIAELEAARREPKAFATGSPTPEPAGEKR